jgi:hypothetical protein
LAKHIRVVDNGSKKIHRFYERHFFGQQVHGRVIRSFETDEQLVVLADVQPGERLGQVPWPELARSAGSRHRARQMQRLLAVHVYSP